MSAATCVCNRIRGGSTEGALIVTLPVNFENLPNHLNPAGYQGAITGRNFPQPTSINTGFGGGRSGRATGRRQPRPTTGASNSASGFSF